ncbi:MAG: hypothetical protein HOK61_03360 [Alphaproteobacteria bacterium]|mgnify:CR=1 FL=1|jgi:hypothetical protein|nr:hypothetical protein [Alphaproteobacteria bacterium]
MSETVELVRDVLVADLPDEGQTIQILVDRPECDAIAARLGVPALASLEATVVVVRVETGGGGGGVRVSGTLRAQVTQQCVVSLELFDSEAVDSIDSIFVRNIDDTEFADIERSSDEPLIEHLNGNKLCLGELVVEHLALALDPYPRRPDQSPDEITYSLGPDGPSTEIETEKGPFSALGELRRKM